MIAQNINCRIFKKTCVYETPVSYCRGFYSTPEPGIERITKDQVGRFKMVIGHVFRIGDSTFPWSKYFHFVKSFGK